jgi:LmbE family N-acetylglucosaminyl deacetylase
MSKAVAVVAHHDDHVLWMGGAIQRLATAGWHWTLIAMCVPARDRLNYFHHCCSIFGATPIAMQFQDYQGGDPFSKNNRDEMRSRLLAAIDGQTFDCVFTHSRGEHGEYWVHHANHVEVRELVTELTQQGQLGPGCQRLAYFSYDVIYKGGTATCARLDANFYLPLTYPELLWKCQLCSLAPDANSSLKNLAFPCPNPEGFEGDKLELPDQFVRRG